MVTETVDMEVHVSALNCTSLRGDLETKLKNIHFKKSVSNNFFLPVILRPYSQIFFKIDLD